MTMIVVCATDTVFYRGKENYGVQRFIWNYCKVNF